MRRAGSGRGSGRHSKGWFEGMPASGNPGKGSGNMGVGSTGGKPERKWRQPSGLQRKTQDYVFPESPHWGNPEARKGRAQLPPLSFRLLPSMTLDLPDLRGILGRRERHRDCLPPRGSRGRSSRGAPRGKGRGIDRPSEGQTPRWSARNVDTPRTGRDRHYLARDKTSHTGGRKRGFAAGTECRDTADPWQARDVRRSTETTPLDLTVPSTTPTEGDWGVGTRSTPSPGQGSGSSLKGRKGRGPSLESPHTSEPEESDVLEVDPDSTYAAEFFQELKMD